MVVFFSFCNESQRRERDRLVENSFVEGLTPHEFMMQTISFRDSAIYQALRVSEPGVLFKNLMLFGRDVHIYYDGTVRNHHNNRIIQFLYGGLQTCKEDNEVKNPQKDPKYLAGEPVGILSEDIRIEQGGEYIS